MDLRLPEHLIRPGMAPPRDDPPHDCSPLPPRVDAAGFRPFFSGLRDWRSRPGPARAPTASSKTPA